MNIEIYEKVEGNAAALAAVNALESYEKYILNPFFSFLIFIYDFIIKILKKTNEIKLCRN